MKSHKIPVDDEGKFFDIKTFYFTESCTSTPFSLSEYKNIEKWCTTWIQRSLYMKYEWKKLGQKDHELNTMLLDKNGWNNWNVINCCQRLSPFFS